jgi:ABC-type arginine transport system permease subunit
VREEGKIPEDTVTDAQVDQSSQRLFTFLGIAASIFLFFVAIIIFVGLRGKKSRDAIANSDESA